MIIKEIFRVLYSPMKAFEEIAKTPDIKGPLLILLLALLASAGVQYAYSTKSLLQNESRTGYAPLAATEIFAGQLISTLEYTLFRFVLNWLIYGMMFVITLKVFREKEGPWHHVLIIIGYTLMVAVLLLLVNAIIVSTLPEVKFDFEVWNGALEGNEEMIETWIQTYESSWGPLLALRVQPFLVIVLEVWTAALCAVAIHFLRDVSWKRAIIFSAIVSATSVFFRLPMIF